MIAFGGADDLRLTIREHAARGEWNVVRSLLSGASLIDYEPELILLRAEAELRLGAPRVAADQLRSAFTIISRSGDAPSLRRACNLLGAATFELGDLAESHAAFSRALDLANAALQRGWFRHHGRRLDFRQGHPQGRHDHLVFPLHQAGRRPGFLRRRG